MKKTIAAAALSASTSALALWAPPAEQRTICLDKYENESGAIYGGSCDQSANNETLGLELLENGCAEGQIAITSQRYHNSEQWSVNIGPCLPPNVAQL